MRTRLLRLFCFLTLGLALSLQASAKRYELKSGIIEYKISGGGSMLGITTKTEGTSKLYFTDYGAVELQERIEKSSTMGQTTIDHTLTKFDHGTTYSVNQEQKVIYKKDIGLFKEMDKEGKDIGKMGKEMMQKMGGKKIGNGKILGYPCEIWEVLGSKVWLYKGVPLKSEANIMGFKYLEVATKAQFNTPIPKEKLALPNYPIKDIKSIANMPSNDTSSAPSQQPSPEQMKQMQEMLQNLGNMFGK